jgi:hypothetical protein
MDINDSEIAIIQRLLDEEKDFLEEIEGLENLRNNEEYKALVALGKKLKRES